MYGDNNLNLQFSPYHKTDRRKKRCSLNFLSIVVSWVILDKMFGNKTLIANKLKNQLKGIKGSGKEDHDVVIYLTIEVKTIEKRLKELELDQMLNFDDEYLSAVFKALPFNDRREWLKFDKTSYTYEWEAMVVFLERARD